MNSSVPKEINDLKTKKDAKFDVQINYCGSWGYYGMVRMATEAICGLYPSAKVKDARIPGGTGVFDVIVKNSKGEEDYVFSKNNGDGKLNYTNLPSMVKKLQELVEK